MQCMTLDAPRINQCRLEEIHESRCIQCHASDAPKLNQCRLEEINESRQQVFYTNIFSISIDIPVWGIWGIRINVDPYILQQRNFWPSRRRRRGRTWTWRHSGTWQIADPAPQLEGGDVSRAHSRISPFYFSALPAARPVVNQQQVAKEAVLVQK